MSVTALGPQFRHCPKCETLKPRTDFTVRKTGAGAGQSVAYCKPCSAKAAREANAADDTRYRRIEWPSKLRSKYGIEPEDYYAMLEKQGGGCALCAVKVPSHRHYSRRGKPETFHVDHCHATGRVRGLLCHLCNRALGLIKDNAVLADRMGAYLRQGD